jgi:hypothetical protein
MRDRLLKRGAAKRLVAGLAPPFDRRVGQPRLREMMRRRFRRRLGGRGEAVAEDLGDAAMHQLAPALEQIFVSCVLNQRVLETILGVGRQALDQQDVGFGQPIQRGLQGRILHAGERP